MKKQYKIQLPKGKIISKDSVKTHVEYNEWDDFNYLLIEALLEKEKKQKKYEPKDGDFVYVKAGYEYIAIFKKEVGEDMYVYANWNMSFSVSKIIVDDSIPLCCISDIKEIRPSTEREKKILIDQLAKVNKKWNEETRTIEDVRWRADYGGTYYFVDKFIKASPHNDCRFGDNNFDYTSGNYFKTPEAAEKAAEQIRKIFKNLNAE